MLTGRKMGPRITWGATRHNSARCRVEASPRKPTLSAEVLGRLGAEQGDAPEGGNSPAIRRTRAELSYRVEIRGRIIMDWATRR